MVPAAAIAALLSTPVGLGVYLATIVVNLAISAVLGKILAPDIPKDSRDVTGVQNVIKSNVTPRRIIYGEAMVGGPYIYLSTSDDYSQDQIPNDMLNMMIVLSTHPVEDILGVVINDQYIDISGVKNTGTNQLNSDWWVKSGRYSAENEEVGEKVVQIIKNLGWGYADINYVNNKDNAYAVADRAATQKMSDVLPSGDWAYDDGSERDAETGLYTRGGKATKNGHRVTNCAHILLRFRYVPGVWSGIPTVKFHVKGKRLYNPAYDPEVNPNAVAPFNTHDRDDPDTWEYTNPNETNDRDLGEDWTLCVLDYLINKQYGIGANWKTTDPNDSTNEINWDSFITSFNHSFEICQTGSSDFDPAPRFTINGVLETGATPISNIEALLTSGAGELIHAQGKYKIKAGVYYPPKNDLQIINEDMIVSSLQIQTQTPRSELFNKVGGIFTDKGYDERLPIDSEPDPAGRVNYPQFIPADFELVDPLDPNGDNPYELIDGEEIIQEFDFPFTTREYEAQRLARIQLERVRQGLKISFTANMQVLKFSVGDTVYLEILTGQPPDGQVSKYFNEDFYNRLGLDKEVQLHPDIDITDPNYDPEDPNNRKYYKQFKIVEMNINENSTIAITMVEESKEIYDWNDGDANLTDYTLEPPLRSDGPDLPILTPIFQEITENIGVAGGTTVTTLITWLAPTRTTAQLFTVLDKRHISYYTLEYGIVDNAGDPNPANRVTTWISGGNKANDWEAAGDIQGPLALETLYKDGVDYDFRLRSVTYNGRYSVWTYYSTAYGDYSPTPASTSSYNFYYIRPTNGTAIRNSDPNQTLVVEARTIENGIDELIQAPSTIQLYVGENLVTAPNYPNSDGYTGYFTADLIDNSILVELRDPGGTVYDSITLVDVVDGSTPGSGESAVYGYIEATNGLAWTRAPNAGNWNPSQYQTNLDVTFVKGGTDVARVSRAITLDPDTGALSDSLQTGHLSGNLNTSRITAAVTNDPSTAITVKYSYLNGTDKASVAETVISSQGGLNSAYNYARVYASFETSPPTWTGATATATIDTIEAWLGSKSLKVVANNNDGYCYLGTNTTNYNILIPAGQNWVFSAYVKLENTNSPKVTNNVNLYIKHGGSHTAIGNKSVAADGEWHRIYGTLNLTGSTATTALLRVDNDSYNSLGDTTMYFDGLQLEIDNGTGLPTTFSDTPPPGDDGIDGEASYTAALSNDAFTIPCLSDGTVKSYVGSGTRIYAYRGDVELDSVQTTPGEGQFKVTAVGTDITPGSLSTGSSTYAIYNDHSSMLEDTAYITYSINCENSTTLTKLQTFSKAYDGEPGEPPVGTTGDFSPGLVGGYTDFVVTLNTVHGTGAANPGEIRIQGNTFEHPNGTRITTASQDFSIYTAYEGAITGKFFLMYSATVAETRFGGVAADWGGGSPDDTRFVCVTWDIDNGWRARNNGGAYYAFTPSATDCLLAAFEKVATSGGIQTFVPYYSGLKGRVGWTHNLLFSATDYNTVAWGTGTIWTADGATYSISPGGNTGNMSASLDPYYIYFDKDVSETALQVANKDAAANAVGVDKILIASAEVNPDTAGGAIFYVFGGRGGLLIGADNIAANSIVANKIKGGEINASKLNVEKLVSATDNADIFNTSSIATRIEIEGSSTYPLWYGSGAIKDDANAKFYLKDDGTIKFTGSDSGDEVSSFNAHLYGMYPIFEIKQYESGLQDVANGPNVYVPGDPAPPIARRDFRQVSTGSAGHTQLTGSLSFGSWGTAPGDMSFYHPQGLGADYNQRLACGKTTFHINANAHFREGSATVNVQYRYVGPTTGAWNTCTSTSGKLQSYLIKSQNRSANASFDFFWESADSFNSRIDFRVYMTVNGGFGTTNWRAVNFSVEAYNFMGLVQTG